MAFEDSKSRRRFRRTVEQMKRRGFNRRYAISTAKRLSKTNNK